MFSVEEKKLVASKVEELLLSLNHPEMTKDKAMFSLHVQGKEVWSYADIEPNWLFEQKGSPNNPNPWNEVARDVLK